MLEIVNYGKDEYGFPALIALGCFDGLHKGHTELLKKAKLQAKINGLDFGVMMFVGGKGGRQLFTFEERLRLLQAFQVKFVLAIDYTEEFKKTAALDFLQNVEEKINVKAYMSGKDFRFGAGAKGKASTLKKYAEDEDNGVWYTPIKDVTFGEDKISSTLIKDLLAAGDIQTANELLGRNYFVTGVVTTGAERGSSLLGFPTINLRYPEDKAEVKQGVYQVKCVVGEDEYEGIANYGPRPTFDESEPVLEVYLKDFDGDLYGQQVTVEFVDYIRDIKKFDGAEELSNQLKEDLTTLDPLGEEPPQETEEEVAEPEQVEEIQETEVQETVGEQTETEPTETEEEVTEPEQVEEIQETEVPTENEEEVTEPEQAEEIQEIEVQEIVGEQTETEPTETEEEVTEPEQVEEIQETEVQETAEEQTETELTETEEEVAEPEQVEEIQEIEVQEIEVQKTPEQTEGTEKEQQTEENLPEQADDEELND